MTIQYVSVEDAIEKSGLRMIVVGGVPSPWGEAAKGIFHVKGIEWSAVRLAYDSDTLKQWAGQRSGPIAFFDKEQPRHTWNDILLLAERLKPEPALLPADAESRALVLGLSHEVCGEQGLGWSRRLQLVHAGLAKSGGFPERVAAYLGKKYGYGPEAGAACGERVVQLLGMLTARLQSQRAAGKRYYMGEQLTAIDIYSATFMGLFAPLPQDVCTMDPATRAAFETRDPQVDAALSPILLEHRDMMYAQHLELPLSL